MGKWDSKWDREDERAQFPFSSHTIYTWLIGHTVDRSYHLFPERRAHRFWCPTPPRQTRARGVTRTRPRPRHLDEKRGLFFLSDRSSFFFHFFMTVRVSSRSSRYIISLPPRPRLSALRWRTSRPPGALRRSSPRVRPVGTSRSLIFAVALQGPAVSPVRTHPPRTRRARRRFQSSSRLGNGTSSAHARTTGTCTCAETSRATR